MVRGDSLATLQVPLVRKQILLTPGGPPQVLQLVIRPISIDVIDCNLVRARSLQFEDFGDQAMEFIASFYR